MKKVVLCVTNNLVLDQRVHKVATTLMDMGFDVTCVGSSAVKSHSVSRLYGVVLLPSWFAKGVLFFLEYNLRLVLHLLFHRYDILVSNDLDTLGPNVLVSRLKRKKLVFDSHEYYPELPELHDRKFKKNTWLALEKWCMKYVEDGYTVCTSIADIYKEKYNKDFKVVRNVPLTTKVKPAVGMVQEEKLILYQGVLNEGRGLEACIAAMEFLPSYRLLIVGGGYMMAALKKQVAQSDFKERIEFTGMLPFEQLAALTHKASVGLCLLKNKGLNYYYALPNRVFDYMRAGVPILATNFPEIKRIVGHYNTGYLLDGMHPKDIAVAITDICENKTLREGYIKGMAHAAEELHWDNESQVLSQIYAL